MVVKSGRYGFYVTDGETNASLREREGDTVEDITPERGAELLQGRRDAGPSTRGRRTKKAAPKKAAAKKTAAKKTTAKKAAVKKTAAKKTAAKKTTAKKATD
jgi:DNA topoisomerase-1